MKKLKSIIKNKKAQMKIQQMAIMLMAVTLFFILVGMFILVFKLSSIKDVARDLEEKNAMLLVSKISNSPEFACGDAFGTGKTNCIDADKALVLKQSIDKYEGFWGGDIENIEIRKVYPVGTGEECNLATYPDCDVIKMYDKEVTGNALWSFALLCRKADKGDGRKYDKCEIAKIFVSYSQNA